MSRDPETCITCGDVGVEMRIIRIDDDRELALCQDIRGRTETVEIGLVEASPGDTVLVHAATAIVALGSAP